MPPAERHDRKRRIRGRAFAPGLRAFRGLCGGSQASEATRAGVSLRTWARWEAQETQAPLSRIAGVAERWHVNLEDLLEPTPDRLAQVEVEQHLRRLVAEHGDALVRGAAARVLGAVRSADDSMSIPLDDGHVAATERTG
jgi:transcriptional regulator with XRE-family HTH domain